MRFIRYTWYGTHKLTAVTPRLLSVFISTVVVAGLFSCSENNTSSPPPTLSIAPAAFPLHVKPGTRYLVDDAGNPFLIQGDAAWSLIAELTRDEVDTYLDSRRSQGFNSILVNLIEHKFSSNPPNNAYGEPPFLIPGDYSTPNDKYFAHADWVLSEAAKKGFLVLLVPSYTGYKGGDAGWYQEMVANGSGKLREYGRYLGQRYAGFSNIMWVHGGDYNPPDKDLSRQIALGIVEYDTRSLGTAHCASETAAIQYWAGEPWLDVNSIYTTHPVYEAAYIEYSRTNIPFFLIESQYENEYSSTELRIRTQAYHALLAGAMGQVFGNNPIWHFSGPGVYATKENWHDALDSAGSRSMTFLRKLFESFEWWRLTPDIDNTLLVTGLDTGQSKTVAAVANNREFALIYIPKHHTVTLNFEYLAGPHIVASWYDPTSGMYTNFPSMFVASGLQKLASPAKNSNGESDWVLVLRSTK